LYTINRFRFSAASFALARSSRASLVALILLFMVPDNDLRCECICNCQCTKGRQKKRWGKESKSTKEKKISSLVPCQTCFFFFCVRCSNYNALLTFEYAWLYSGSAKTSKIEFSASDTTLRLGSVVTTRTSTSPTFCVTIPKKIQTTTIKFVSLHLLKTFICISLDD
jgi:hypothetical protein